MRPRPAEKAYAKLEEREEGHHEKLSRAFLSETGARYHGRSIDEVTSGDWGGRVSRGARSKIVRFLDGPSRGFVVIRGTKGLGKTTLAVTLADEVVHRDGVSGAFRSLPLLLSQFSFRPDNRDPLAEATSPTVLVLDDAGAANEGVTPHQERSLWALLEARWSDPNALTIITTNMSIADTTEGDHIGIGLSTWMGPSMWDRVSDGAVLVELSGESFRGASD